MNPGSPEAVGFAVHWVLARRLRAQIALPTWVV